MGENISANDFCRYIWKSYLEDRRYDLVNEFVSDKISVIGTGAHEIERNLHEFIAKFTEDDVSTQFERIITAFGIVAAIIIVAVVLFVFSRLTGIFRQGSNKPTTETVSMTTEDSTTVVDINTEDQINMPSVLGLPQDMAREKLKESSLVMEITGSEYSDNYTEGQVMGQDILAGTVVKKWSTVGVTISKGSDKVDLNALDLTQMTGEDARLLLEQKGLVVEVREENSDTAIKGNVIRFSPQVVKVGESVS